MRIVHGSDWHGFPRRCPEADLYIFTGDMLDNFPIGKFDERGRMLDWPKIVPDHERVEQAKQVRQFIGNGGMRRYLGSPDAPIVCVRGNHDFIDLAPMFEGCNLVHEFVNNELVEVGGLKITGHRGIPYIYGGWNDEEQKADLKDRYRTMPMADVYVTHYPPYGILDSNDTPDVDPAPGQSRYMDPEHYGLEGLGDFLLYRGARALHCFGHVHEYGGMKQKHGSVWFSNAACNVNEIDF